VICSPTATGKSHLALQLAQSAGAEILNADSLQVYRYMDIGTAKPTRKEREKVAHHLIDVVNPDEEYNAAVYSEQARAIIENLAREGKPVFCCRRDGPLHSGAFAGHHCHTAGR
jgi:tRNA dimethylallyltransferase